MQAGGRVQGHEYGTQKWPSIVPSGKFTIMSSDAFRHVGTISMIERAPKHL